ncbi:MAG: hypothetical protein ACREFQ_03300, partial [Stellaceae bacterium]
MRLVSYRHDGEPGVGVMVDDEAFIALPEAAPNFPTNLRLILAIPDWQARVAEAIAGKAPGMRLSQVRLDPVIVDPNAIWALALNYQSHLDETRLTTSPHYPHVFLRHAA